MAARRQSSGFGPKFVTTYTKLLQGLTPEQVAVNKDVAKFWAELLELDVDREFLGGAIAKVSKDECLDRLKPLFTELTATCIHYARTAEYGDVRKAHAVDTLAVVSRQVLGKNLAGWEVMEIFAGGVSHSDKFFNDLAAMIEENLSDAAAPASFRHQVLQLAVIFVCGVNQLSVGAYFLQRNLFPSIETTITSRETEQYGFEALLLLSLLANFHKTDAGRMNPYLASIRESANKDMMRKICWVSNFTANAVVKAYQDIFDDSPPTLASTVGSFLTSLRPDRALSAMPADPPKELFKTQPIEACVILLPFYEFLSGNATFRGVVAQTLDADAEKTATKILPLPYTLLTMSSYLLTHASSSSHRAAAYANLALNILLVLSESEDIMYNYCTKQADIRLCRQRLPLLPYTPARAPVSALLDCCVLWLRHNLHKRLEVHSYITCVRVCHRTLWYMQRERTRLAYGWQDFWRAILGLLDFLSNKADSLVTTGGVEQLAQEAILVIDLALRSADSILPTPKAIHEMIYEVVRSSSVFRKTKALLGKLAPPRASSRDDSTGLKTRAADALADVIAMTEHYEAKIAEAKAQSASAGLRVVSREVDKDGIMYGKRDRELEEPQKQPDEPVGILRYAYLDGMGLCLRTRCNCRWSSFAQIPHNFR